MSGAVRASHTRVALSRQHYDAVIFDMDGVVTDTAQTHFVAWKRTFDGVETFLASRGLKLPRGEPSDDPGSCTAWGVANRKNELFRQALETRREAFQDYFEEIKPHLGEAGKALSQKAAALQDEALRNSVKFLL